MALEGRCRWREREEERGRKREREKVCERFYVRDSVCGGGGQASAAAAWMKRQQFSWELVKVRQKRPRTAKRALRKSPINELPAAAFQKVADNITCVVVCFNH